MDEGDLPFCMIYWVFVEVLDGGISIGLMYLHDWLSGARYKYRPLREEV